MDQIRTLTIKDAPFKLFGEGKRSVLFEAIFYVSVFLLTVILFYVFKPLYTKDYALFKRGNSVLNGAAAKVFVLFLLALLFGVAFFLYKARKMNLWWIIFLFVVAGILIRIGYMLRTPANVRQYDTFTANMNGHQAYAQTIYDTGALPTNNGYQFYHPPLNAFIQSVFMRISSAFAKFFHEEKIADGSYYALFSAGKPAYLNEEQYFLYQTCQILSVLYSAVALMTSLKILSLFGFQSKTLVFASAIVVFFPRNYQLAALLNNDAPAFMFAVLAFYYALKWCKNGKRWHDILLSGLFVGLGMCSKLSSATICLPIAAIFIYEFIISLKKSEKALPIKRIALQYVAFLAICAPIGLWFQIYAKVRFGQSFGFVFSNLNKMLSTADVPLFERLFITFNKNEWFGSFFIRNFKNNATGLNNNYNLFNYSVRSSVFGEFGYWEGEPFAQIALIFAFAFCLFALIGLIYSAVVFFKNDLFDRSEEAKCRNLDITIVAILIISQIFSITFFYIKMPYSCTMDFRYIMPLILGIALSTPMITERLEKEGVFAKIISRTMVFIEIIFLISSSVFYTLCV